jgi:hypothetical protein
MSTRLMRQTGTAIFATGIVLTSLASLTLMGASARAVTTDSTVSVAWADRHPESTSPNVAELENLVFTISQTNNLSHQGIEISWTGGLGTTSSTPGKFDTNYVQIMQCWGDDLPSPEQCQFGAAPNSVRSLVGSDAATRGLGSFDPAFVKAEHPELQYPTDPAVFMFPYLNVRDVEDRRKFDFGTLFDSSITNEVVAARTGQDGTGRVTFEVQTTLESPHMGCGGEATQADGSSFARPCWLVIVPRGAHNPDGTEPDFPASISGSPFTPSVWQDSIMIPLGFELVSQSCELGQAERRLVGNEVIADAFTSWQPTLCQSGTTFGFSMIGDDEARAQIVSDVSGASRMAFVSSPLTDEERGTAAISYAPVAKSALVFAFNIEYNVFSDAPPEVLARNGTKMGSLVLNQRLVAKLLTQSYRVDVPCYGANSAVISGNPRSITKDQEFIALNPDFAYWADTYPEGLLVALGSSDANRDVWSWIRSSPDAVSFLSGTPDEWGMQINPAYVSLNLGTSAANDSFPRTDLTVCKQTEDLLDPGFGSLDLRPYYSDMQETASRTLRADANVKTTWDPFKLPPGYRNVPAQLLGERLMLSLTDASAAARFGLDVAAITNANGDTVLPTLEAIDAGVSEMQPSGVDGVFVSNPATTAEGAYPLAQVVYAAINVCPIDATIAADYAKVLTYAASDGQYSGSFRGALPLGYVPMSDAQRASAATLAEQLANVDAMKPACTPPASAAGPTSSSSSSGGSSRSAATAMPVPTPSPSMSASAAPSRAVAVDRVGIDTSLAGLGLVAGIPMCIAGPIMLVRARKLND